MPDKTQQTTYSVPPVERAFRLLRYIGEGNDCANVEKASKDLAISRTTLIRLIQTLLREQAIAPAVGGTGYQLGMGLVSLATTALRDQNIVNIANPILRTLADELLQSAHLGVLDGNEVVYLAKQVPNYRLVSNIDIGSRLPVYATTLGRIILANLKPDKAQKVLAETRPPGELKQFIDSLSTDRAEGLSWSVENYEAGVGSCAAPLFNRSGEVVAAINVIGPDRFFRPESDRRAGIASAVSHAGQNISLLLGFSEGHKG